MAGCKPNEATSFVAELLKCRNCAQHFIVYERQKFSKPKARMIYKDLRGLRVQETTQYFTCGDRCFGHLPVVDVYQMKMYARS